MNNLLELISQFETSGGELTLLGDRVRVKYPPDRKGSLTSLLDRLRAQRGEVAELLRARAMVPAMPPGVRLLGWNLKHPPVAIETCGVVVDPALFARTTLEQLRVALAEPVRWVGWSIPQLIDRLAQVGVVVELEPPPKRIDEEYEN